jgi:hypothetical protein
MFFHSLIGVCSGMLSGFKALETKTILTLLHMSYCLHSFIVHLLNKKFIVRNQFKNSSGFSGAQL